MNTFRNQSKNDGVALIDRLMQNDFATYALVVRNHPPGMILVAGSIIGDSRAE